MEPLTLDEAIRMMTAGRARADELGIKVSIAILDPRGDIVALNRMDGALWRSVPISQGKAAASAAWICRAATFETGGTSPSFAPCR